jgi:HPt (histidine-containing phosphotransfer) domain-containing protein
MDGYLAKPVSIESLHAILLPFFEEKKSVSTSLQSTGTQGLKTYHRERLFSLFSGNEELIAEVERLICSGVFEKYLSQLSDLLSSNASPGQVQKLAHTIKGASLNAGLERMAALASELDQQNLPDPEEGKKVLQHLREELENVLKEIKKDTTLS